jgi:nickel transport protein
MKGWSMKRSKLFISAVAAAAAGCFLLASIDVSAHAIWFAQRSKQLALIYGIGSDDLDAVKRLPLINASKGYDANWKEVPISLKANGPIVTVDSDVPLTAVSAVMDYGTWARAKDGEFYKKTREELPDAVMVEHNYKYGVFLNSLTATVPVLAGQTLQIVPVGPIPDQFGKPAKFKVLFNGKPQAGVQFMHDYVNDPDQVPQVTAADGTVTVNIRNQGPNVLAAIYVAPTDNKAKYDQIEHRATLSFALPHKPE